MDLKRRLIPGHPSLLGRWLDRFVVVLLALIAVPFVLLSFYAHPLADDFCEAVTVRDLGPLGMMQLRYASWNGRYFGLAVISAVLDRVDLIQSFWAVGVVTLLALFVSIWVFVATVAKRWLSQHQALIAAVGLFGLYLAGMPRPATAFYWFTGAVSNQMAIILILLLLAVVCRDYTRSGWATRFAALLGGAMLTLAAIGTYETPMMILLYLLVIGTATAFVIGHPNRRLWALCLAVSLMGIAIVLQSPGITVRSGYFPNRHQLWFSIDHSLTNSIKWLSQSALSVTLLSATVLVLPALGAPARRLRRWAGRYTKWLLVFPVLCVALPVLSFFPAFWSMGSQPPPRVLNAVYLFVLLGWFGSVVVLMACFWPREALAATRRRHQSLNPARYPIVSYPLLQAVKVVFVFALIGQGNFIQAVADLKSFAPTYHAAMGQRYDRIVQAKARGERHVRVPALPSLPKSLFISDIRAEPGFWINQAVAQYFQVESIAIEPSLHEGLVMGYGTGSE